MRRAMPVQMQLARPRQTGAAGGPGRPRPGLAAFSLAALAALPLLAGLLTGCAGLPAAPGADPLAEGPRHLPPSDAALFDARDEPAPQPLACPAGLPEGTRCLGGRDRLGAHILVAVPARWSGVLVLHAHGGPELGVPSAQRTAEDLQRWKLMVELGHAWAGSSFRQGGVEVRAAAEDTERLRRIVLRHVAQPRLTVLHGQSWGASVAAVGAEMFATAAAGRSPYDAVLLTSGVLGGGTRSYDFRLDLRVVYQQLCNNHPAPDEPAYPLWMGLPPGSTLTRAQLADRVDACLGNRRPAAQRSAEQQRRLDTLLRVIRIRESSLQGHLNWATWHFQDIVQQRSGGRSPFGNIGAEYSGSADDAALNASVARYAADPAAVARLRADTDPGGRIPVPVLAVHGVDDPVAFVELQAVFAQTMARGGSAARLVQTYTAHAEHSYLSDATYATLMDALLRWQAGGDKPTPQGIADACPRRGPAAQCRFLPGYQPAPLVSRVTPRQRP